MSFFRTAIFSFCLGVMSVWVMSATADAAEPSQRPNIVLIMCDDMGFSDIGCFGSEIRTPNIDRLAAEGMLFTQFYNNAKCTTTRASLITGVYPRPKGGLLQPNMLTIAEGLRSAGYRTALTGKWHLGANAPRRPIDRGFDHFYGLLDGCCNFFDPAQPDPEFKGGRVRVFAEDETRITEFPDDFYTTDAFTDKAIAFVKRQKPAAAPFFLHVCYTAPHYPLHAPPEDVAKYEGQYELGWDQLRRQRYDRQLSLQLIDPAWSLPGREREVTAWDQTPDRQWQARVMAVYAAMIDRMDQNIGRLLQTLEDEGQLDETLIMFLSDNGGCAETPGGMDPRRTPGPKDDYTACGPGWAWAQNTPFRRYKSWVHEGGISTPLLVRWPATVKAGTRTNQVGHIIDVLPTCLEVAGVDYPADHDGTALLPCEGRSLLPILHGEQRESHERLYWEWSGNRAVRHRQWKLCWDKGVKRWELYDIVADRTEMHDMAADHPELVEELAASWFAWAKDTGNRAK